MTSARWSAVAVTAAGLVGLGLLAPTSAAVPPAARYSSRDVVLGAVVRTVVDPATRPRHSRLVLQRRFPDRWRTVDSTARLGGRGFVLRVPTDRIGRLVVRVAARRAGRVVSTSRPREVLVRAPYSPVGRAAQHRFSARPVIRWDSCRPIRWTFNGADAPGHGLRQVRRAVRRVEEATGLSFVYVGRTGRTPTAYGRRLSGANVIVGWRPGADYSVFRNNRSVGIGGNRFVTGYREADGTRVSRAVRGGVVLNSDRVGELRPGFGRGFTWGEVIMHELGHVVGLAHTQARRQILAPHVTRRKARWGAGDLAGLRRVGDRNGCLQRTSSRTASGPERLSRR